MAFDLEPDLKDGRGGLRDVHALAWARAAGAEVDPKLLAELERHHDTLLEVRIELLQTEVRRIEDAIKSKRAGATAADAFFKR